MSLPEFAQLGPGNLPLRDKIELDIQLLSVHCRVHNPHGKQRGWDAG